MKIEFHHNKNGNVPEWSVILIVGDNKNVILAQDLRSYGDCQQFWIDFKYDISCEPEVKQV